ncbi:BQ2448_843 [Microbotryum intermedium]|uniref:BQ2448_843 protein n=1 Tax=Microbotryum intermedium TaxID=269621 RepID=A0A238F3L6_9BASI|nr:BQ2448_843 [Microbotryum intermedium]
MATQESYDPTTLDELQSLVAASQFEPALALSLRLRLEPSYTSYLAQRVYLALTRDGATPSLDDLERLYPLIVDDEWLAIAACHLLRSSAPAPSTTTTSTSTQLTLYALEKALEASDVLAYLRPELGELIEDANWERLDRLVHKDPSVKKGCWVRNALLEMRDRKNTFQEIWGTATDATVDAPEAADAESEPKVGDNEHDQSGALDAEHDDDQDRAGMAKPSTNGTSPTITLPSFLSQPLLDTALFLAATSQLDALKTVASRHVEQLWPHRFTILNSIPEWKEPSSYAELLPSLGKDLVETKWTGKPWRQEPDWVEHISLREDDDDDDEEAAAFKPQQEPLAAEALAVYYTKRVEHIASLGLVSTALSLVQHCAARLNISRLEELGEELSLLSRLVYDRPNRPRHASTSRSTLDDPAETFTLTHWRSLEPPSIVEAYLSTSTPSNIATSIRRLVLPYLSVLEARLERLGQPDPTLSSRLLIDYLLGLAASTPPQLALLVAVIEASKPTLSSATRLIKSDEDLARLALACIYGCRDSSAETLVWFGKIFECLPAFNEAFNDGATSSSVPKMTLYSLVSSSASAAPTPKALYASLIPFDASRLSASLDILDLHLAQAEVFSRYSCAVPLSWFLTSHNDLKAQKAWATRLARTASTGGGGKQDEEGEFESEDEWVALMEDMVAFTHGREEQGDGLRKAFGLLSEEDVLRIFFGGLIAAGRIPLAKSLLQPSSRSAPLEPKAIEELVIAASREFYDNALSGNLNKGEMKMAFDCLSAAPQTPLIRQERDFIEATSRLCSYKIQSHPGITVAPIEIRLSKDRLEFVRRLLGANEDAYRHPEVILDLVSKLGYHQDRLAQVRTMAMIADSSLQAGDFEKTVELCDKMVAKVEEIRRESSSSSTMAEPELVAKDVTSKKRLVGDEAAEYAWRECFQLGKHDVFQDLDRRLVALGQALLLCPGDKIVSVLPVWTALEQRVAERPAHLSTRKGRASRPGRAVTEATKMVEAGVGAALSSGVKAKETLSRAAAFFSGQTQAHAHLPQRSSHQQNPSGSMHPQAREKTADRRSSIYGLDQVASNSNTTSRVHPSPRRHPLSPPSRGQGGGRGGIGGAQGRFRAGLSGMAAAGVGWLIGADEERGRLHQQEHEQEEPW